MNEGKVFNMTTLRKWRFPILIGAGLIAAGALFYVSNYHVNPEKTQGAIGKRDVYRDGEVSSADVGTPGAAPVAVKAVLESGEFKALAKNPAFQEMLKSESFTQLSTNPAFLSLLSNTQFRSLAQTQAFAAMIQSSAVQGQGGGATGGNRLFAGLENNSQYSGLARSAAFQELTRNDSFIRMLQQPAFLGLLMNNSFQLMMANSQFGLLASQASFQSALLSGNAANLTLGMTVRY
jgi:hypothetical protein